MCTVLTDSEAWQRNVHPGPGAVPLTPLGDPLPCSGRLLTLSVPTIGHGGSLPGPISSAIPSRSRWSKTAASGTPPPLPPIGCPLGASADSRQGWSTNPPGKTSPRAVLTPSRGRLSGSNPPARSLHASDERPAAKSWPPVAVSGGRPGPPAAPSIHPSTVRGN